MKTKNITKSVAAAALMVFAVSVFAKPGPYCHPCKRHLAKKMHCMAIGNKQKKEIKKVMQIFRKQVLPIRQQLLVKKTMLNAELVQKKIDESKVNALIKQINNLHNQLYVIKIETRIQLHKATGLVV